MTRQIPELAERFVAQCEGEVLRVYDDARPEHVLQVGEVAIGTLTAGTGHTGADLRIGMAVTADMSRAWRLSDLLVAAKRLERVADQRRIDALSEHQYAAILSFVFNLGTSGKTIWSLINAGAFDQVPGQIMRFDKVKRDGVLVELPGLIHRRMAEVSVWRTPDVPTSVAVAAFDQSVELVKANPGDPRAPLAGDTMRATLAAVAPIVASAPVVMPSSSLTRDVDTPPTPAGLKSLAKSKSFAAQVGTLVVAATGALSPVVASVHAGATSIEAAIQPYAANVPMVAKVDNVLMIALAVTAALAVVLTVHKHNDMQNG